MNPDNSTAEKQIALFLTMVTSSIDLNKIDNLKLNQILEDFFNDFYSLVRDFAVDKYLHFKDGVIVTWPLSSGIDKLNCLRLPIAFQQLINTKSNYYHSRYGETPKMSVVETIYKNFGAESPFRDKPDPQKQFSELITLSDLSEASGGQFLFSEELKSLCEADGYYQNMSINFVQIPPSDLPFSIFSLKSK